MLSLSFVMYLQYIQYLSKCLDNQVHIIAVLSKAFDMDLHPALIMKLESFGMHNCLL